MSRPQKVDLQRCFLHGNVPRGVEDDAPYKREMRFFDTLKRIRQWIRFFCHRRVG